MRRAAKRDDNEALIVRALQSAGWTVFRVSDTGLPDLLCARDGKVTLLEVKGPDGTLTEAQIKTFTSIAEAGVLVQVVRSPREALEAVEAPWTTMTEGRRWYSINGAFLCESCWLPENGLHAKDCPTRKALAKSPKVQSAYRAAKALVDALPTLSGDAARAAKEAIGRASVYGEATVRVAEDGVVLISPRGVEGELQPLPKKLRPKSGGA